MAALMRFLLLFMYASCVTFICADDIERTARRGGVIKLLREMVNQTKADTLNLPANASSIRENITDTFSCENRTYGYYADVDNECQIFHVCLTSQTSSGRNVTYRWSFICPNETVFNQEVLTCTRPNDAIDCEDSPMFYHLNMDIGKVPNDTETQANPGNNTSTSKNQRRKPIRKQNLIVENLMKEVKKEKLVVENLDEELTPVIEEVDIDNRPTNEDFNKITEEQTKKRNEEIPIEAEVNEEFKKNPVIHEANGEYTMKGKRMENARLSSERSLKRRGRKINRGSFRFKADRY